jgi:hypothetical protein
LHAFVAANMAPGATIKTDSRSAYPGAPNVAHDPHVIGKMAAHVAPLALIESGFIAFSRM